MKENPSSLKSFLIASSAVGAVCFGVAASHDNFEIGEDIRNMGLSGVLPDLGQKGVTTISTTPNLNATINPLSKVANPKALNNVVDESRVAVPLHSSDFWGVGRIVQLIDHNASVTQENVFFSCTGAYVTGANFEDKSILTSAHCFYDGNMKPYDLNKYRFIAHFIDDSTGHLQQFVSPIEISSIKSDYHSENPVYFDLRLDRDLATIELSYELPDEISPLPVDYADYSMKSIMALGYSADKAGLHSDTRNDGFYDRYYRGIFGLTWLDLGVGASGGPLIAEINGKLQVIGVNTALSGLRSVHSLITPESMASLHAAGNKDFVQNTANNDDYRCVRITAEALNFRDGPGTNYPVVGQGFAGDAKVVFDGIGSWSKIITDNGDYGYMHSGFVIPISCP